MGGRPRLNSLLKCRRSSHNPCWPADLRKLSHGDDARRALRNVVQDGIKCWFCRHHKHIMLYIAAGFITPIHRRGPGAIPGPTAEWWNGWLMTTALIAKAVSSLESRSSFSSSSDNSSSDNSFSATGTFTSGEAIINERSAKAPSKTNLSGKNSPSWW